MRLIVAHTQLVRLLWLTVLAISTSVIAAPFPIALPGCKDKCGDVSIPYPFGIGQSNESRQDCFLDHQSFEVACRNTTLISDKFEVLNIHPEGQLEMLFPIARGCRNASKNTSYFDSVVVGKKPSLSMPAFAISSKENKFMTVGCSFTGYIDGFRSGKRSSTGCYSYCYNNSFDGGAENCDGNGCCEVDIPCGMRNISIDIEAYEDSVRPYFNNCSYAFIAKQSYHFSIERFPDHVPEAVPMVVDWAISNWSCADARNKTDFACQKNSECEDTDKNYGYRCRCKDGYDGNPYLPDGCHGICIIHFKC